MGTFIEKYSSSLFSAILIVALFAAFPAHAVIDTTNILSGAQNDISDVSENMADAVRNLPGIISVFSYILGLTFVGTAVMKLKSHVESPNNTPISAAMARLIVGGLLLSMPAAYQAMAVAINGGSNVSFTSGSFSVSNLWSGINGIAGGIAGSIGLVKDFNTVLSSILSSVRYVPKLVGVVAYLLALLIGFYGLLKLKSHIENPDQNPLKEALIRLIVAGALFALPNVFEAMKVSIQGSGGFTAGGVLTILGEIGNLLSGQAVCNSTTNAIGSVTNSINSLGGILTGGNGSTAANQGNLGDIMCNLVMHTGAFSAFLTALSYVFGVVLGLWGVLKIQAHVLNPNQASLWDGISRFAAAGAFFSLPFVIEVFRNTVAPESMIGAGLNIRSIVNSIGSIWNSIFGNTSGQAANVCNGLDGALGCFIKSIHGPLMLVVKTFATFAGMVLIMIGISRLYKSSQEGARGPGGLGTMGTFLIGGALVSYNEILAATTGSLFNVGLGSGTPSATLVYAEGMADAEIAHVTSVFSSILQFMVLVGIISFVRGLFIIRNVAEGSGQASIMAGLTHVVGGALAVNLGPLMNAVQATLGISAYGVAFS